MTYDIRALAPDLVGETAEALPTTRGEERGWSDQIRKRLPAWVEQTALPTLAKALAEGGVGGEPRAEGDKIFIAYQTNSARSDYVRPEVMLEFGARSTGEPNTLRDVACDAARWLDTLTFPTARPRVMRPERTLWEKATAIHVFCLQQRLRGERFARHWHDLVRLDDAGVAETAFVDEALAQAVARHKTMFFAENDASGSTIDYAAAVHGALRLVPVGPARAALARDYAAMINDGLLLDEAEPFDPLMERCRSLEERANRAAKARDG